MAFLPRSIELVGSFELPVAPDAVFPFFSPLGERDWAPGWSPELLHPPGVEKAFDVKMRRWQGWIRATLRQ